MSGTWWNYVTRIADTSNQKQIADSSGIDQTVLSRWKLDKNLPRADKVVAFARAFRRPPTEALVAAGYIEKDETAGIIEVGMTPRDLSADELLAEVRRRMVAVAADGTAAPDPAAHHSQAEHRQAEQWRTDVPDEGMPRDLSEDGYPREFLVVEGLEPNPEPSAPSASRDASDRVVRPRRR